MNEYVNVKKRVLTLKSKLGFGKYESMTVESIIKLNKCDYLRWVYFNCANIDFIPDVLDNIQIPIIYRLTKPASNPDVLNVVNSKAIEKNKFIVLNTDEAKETRKRINNTFKNKKTNLSKILLLRKNHGHK
jgi:hypothetical protein